MPIYLPKGLPALATLRREGIHAHDGAPPPHRAVISVALVNLMPDKQATERQFARVLGAGALDVRLSLIAPRTHACRSTSAEHLATFYRTWIEAREEPLDGLIVTGAPVEHLPFENVDYWSELTQIFDWARTRIHRSLYVCWAAQAALHHRHGVPKHALSEKAFGVFRHRVTAPEATIMEGLGGEFDVPVSRHTATLARDLPERRGLRILAESDESGLCLVEENAGRELYMFNHFEYDADTLRGEYLRDLAKSAAIAPPRHYFPADDPSAAPTARWRPAALRFFGNWLVDIAAQSRRRAA